MSQPTAPEPEYGREELINNAPAVFGVRPEVVIGALHGNIKSMLTVAEVKAAVTAFLGKKVN
ncbi:hypothetical protein GJ688_02030 [Heliobacillus mobilis]|uniref:YqzN/YkzM domain-containing protein n=1 Tax=Heliobacterium mobile TaxID=28064 RepID=A0A6I3SGD4_HELMO|nr:hypothetical protein [Heliobacterium mobile]